MGIRGKLTLMTSVLLASVSLFIYIYFPAEFEQRAMVATTEKATTVAELTAFASIPSLRFGDRTEARAVFAAAVANDDVAYIVLVDPRQEVFEAYQIDAARDADFLAADQITDDGLVYRVNVPIEHAGDLLGRLYLGLSLRAQRESTVAGRRAVAGVSFVVFALGIAAALVISKFITRPLANVVRAVEGVAGGDLGQRVTTTSADEVGQLAKSFNRMAGRLETARDELEAANAELSRSNEDLERFAYIASHDLKEPLRTIANCIQLLERRYGSAVGDDGRQFIAYASDGAKRMRSLLDSLLAYSRLGTDGGDLEPTNVGSIVDQVTQSLAAAVAESGAIVTCGALPDVVADPEQLTQVFLNLMTNALKFRGDEPARIAIDARRREESWAFSVRDHGIGIAPDYLETIFVAFRRLHTHEEYPGVGMGLAISKKIVERHGGEIWAEACEDGGSTFWFTIPDPAV
jgi:signal transduction histidine kinase